MSMVAASVLAASQTLEWLPSAACHHEASPPLANQFGCMIKSQTEVYELSPAEVYGTGLTPRCDDPHSNNVTHGPHRVNQMGRWTFNTRAGMPHPEYVPRAETMMEMLVPRLADGKPPRVLRTAAGQISKAFHT